MKKLLLSIVLLCLIPNEVFALAGWSERSRDYYYTPDIVLTYSFPSDICPKSELNDSQTCIFLYHKGERHNSLDDLGTLTKINLPRESNHNLLFAQSYEDGNWLIYDISREKIIIEESSYQKALDKWMQLTISKPEIVRMGEISKYFELTEEERERLTPKTTFIHGFFGIILLLFFYLSIVNRKRYKDIYSDFRISLLLSIVFVAPIIVYDLIEITEYHLGYSFITKVISILIVPFYVLSFLLSIIPLTIASVLINQPGLTNKFFYESDVLFAVDFNVLGLLYLLVFWTLVGFVFRSKNART